MHLGGLSYVGALSRAASPTSSGNTAAESSPTGNDRPGYFRTISSISHASLAAAYQAMREHEMNMVPVDKPLPGEPNQEATVAEGAIASGAGIPAALSAYSEVIDDGQAGSG